MPHVVRRFLTWLHRYVGLTLALFLIVVGLTGSLLAYYEPLDALLAPELTARPAGAAALEAVELAERVEAAHPELQISLLPLSFPADRALLLSVGPRTADKALSFDEIFVHPATAEIIGQRTWGEISEGMINLMPFIFKLHYSLALGETGGVVLGWIALFWTVDCFVGFYLTLPQRKQRKAGRAPQVEKQLSKGWWSRWRPAWLIKTSGSPYRINFDVHRAGGLWFWPLLFVLAWSSVGMNLHQVFSPVMRAAFVMSPDLPSEEAQGPSEITWRQALELGRQAMTIEAERHGLTVREEVALRYVSWDNAFRYTVRSDKDFVEAGDGETIVSLDPKSGAVKRFEHGSQGTTGDIVQRWLYHFHEGRVFGAAYDLLLAITGVLICALAATGIVIWWKKRSARLAVRRR